MSTPSTDASELSTASSAGNYTEPFGLLSRVRRPSSQLDWIPGLDILAIALMFSLLLTRFVSVSGVNIELPRSGLEMQAASGPVAVLTISNRGMFFFQGGVFELDTLGAGLAQFVQKLEARSKDPQMQQATLLIKTEGSIDVESVLIVIDMAKQSGFQGIQIAAKPINEARLEDGVPSANRAPSIDSFLPAN